MRRGGEQLDRGARKRVLGPLVRRRHGESRQRQQPLALRTEPHARRRAQPQSRRLCEQALDQQRQPCEVLGVVEHEQHVARREVLAHQCQRLLLRARRELQLGGDACGDLRAVVQIVERDPVRSVAEARCEPAQRALREAALADAARADHRQQPAFVAGQQRGKLRQFLFAAIQAVARRGHRPCRAGRHRREHQSAHALRRLDAELFVEAQRERAIGFALLVESPLLALRREQRNHCVLVERIGVEQAARERGSLAPVGRRAARAARASAPASAAAAARARRRASRSTRRSRHRPCRRAVRRGTAPGPRRGGHRAVPARRRARRWRRRTAPSRLASRAPPPTAVRARNAGPCADSSPPGRAVDRARTTRRARCARPSRDAARAAPATGSGARPAAASPCRHARPAGGRAGAGSQRPRFLLRGHSRAAPASGRTARDGFATARGHRLAAGRDRPAP